MKKYDHEIEIDATPDEVWRALTDAEELKRWFPLDARVTPGVGGALWLSWGEKSDWEAPIEVWEPSRHLRTVDTMAGKNGQPPTRVAVDYLIESRGGKTVLRLVHSGFAADLWDDEFDTLSSGWASFQANLKHYLERHRGEPRTLAFVRHPPVPLPRPEVFSRVMALLGLHSMEGLRVGGRYATASLSGDRFEGVVKVLAPPINFTATVENWNDGFVMVEIEPGRERCRPSIWVSLYGSAQGDAPLLQSRLRHLVESAFR